MLSTVSGCLRLKLVSCLCSLWYRRVLIGRMLDSSWRVSAFLNSLQCVLWMRRRALFCMRCSFILLLAAARESASGQYVIVGRIRALYRCNLALGVQPRKRSMLVKVFLAMAVFVVMWWRSDRCSSKVTPRTLSVLARRIGGMSGWRGFK